MNATEKIGQSRFDRLPALIRLGVFCEFSGLERHMVRQLCKAGEIRTFTQGRSQALYYKSDLARVAGFDEN